MSGKLSAFFFEFVACITLADSVSTMISASPTGNHIGRSIVILRLSSIMTDSLAACIWVTLFFMLLLPSQGAGFELLQCVLVDIFNYFG